MIANNNSCFMAPTGNKKLFTKESDTSYMKFTQSRMTFLEALKLDYSPDHDQKEKENMMIIKDKKK